MNSFQDRWPQQPRACLESLASGFALLHSNMPIATVGMVRYLSLHVSSHSCDSSDYFSFCFLILMTFTYNTTILQIILHIVLHIILHYITYSYWYTIAVIPLALFKVYALLDRHM